MARLIVLVSALAALTCLWGCGYQTDIFPAPSWNPDCLAQPTIHIRQRLVVQPPMALLPSRAGLLPVRTPPHLPELSQTFTRIFHRALLEKCPFQEVTVIPDPHGSLADAVRLGQRHKVDLVVLGEIPYFLDGGGLGKSGLQVDLKVVEVKTGRLLWELTDSVTATQRPMVDLWVTETRPRPTPSIYGLAELLAGRLADRLRDQPSLATNNSR